MNITKTHAYKTPDGKFFDHASEALAYMFRDELAALFNGQSPYGIISIMVNKPEVVRDKLNEYLEALDEHPDVDDAEPNPIEANIAKLIRQHYPEYGFARFAYRQQGTREWFVADQVPLPNEHGWSHNAPVGYLQLRTIDFPELHDLDHRIWDKTLICLEDYS